MKLVFSSFVLMALAITTSCGLEWEESTRRDSSTSEIGQIHISFGYSTTEIVVMFASANKLTADVVFGNASQSLTKSVPVESWQFTEGNPNGTQWVYRARLKDLEVAQTYYYQVRLQSGGSSTIYKFTLPKLLDEAYPMQVVMFGDMGKTGGSATLPRLRSEAASGDNTAIIHMGDFAYDLHDQGGQRGDDFMQRIESVAAHIPYMTCTGNHEIPFNFAHYRNRFTMPTASDSPTNDRLWWSLDIGPVHFVSYDTEVYFARKDLIQDQLDFLHQDLLKASSPEQRKNVPWIVAFGHRPMYCSNIDHDDCSTPKSVVRAGLESVMNKYGVDFIVEGHEHSYERMWPVFNESVTQKNYMNPRAPVHVISGQAGCNEDDGLCVNPTFGAKGDWSAFRSWLPGQYGYGRIKFFNATHAQWTQMYDLINMKEESVVVVQENHGPF